MTASKPRLAVRPDRCDRCGACVAACPEALVRIGGGYVSIDATRCTSCFACADVCRSGAIERGVSAAGSMRSGPGAATVVVSSRAEAKALRKAAGAAGGAGAPVAKRPLEARATAAVNRPRTEAASAPRAGLGARLAASIGWTGPRESGGRDAAARPGVSWSPAELGSMIAVMVAAFAAKQVALSSFAFEVMPPAGQVVARSLILATYYGVQIAVMALLAQRRGCTLVSAFALSGSGSTAGKRIADAALITALLFGTRAFSTGWAAIMRGLGWAPPVVEGAGFSALFGAGVAGLALTLAAVAVVGPVAEELLFRGTMLRVLAERIGAWPAVFVTALLYAGSHLEPWVFVSTFVLGLALGWLTWMRGSLRGAMVLHGLYNAVAVIAAYYVAT